MKKSDFKKASIEQLISHHIEAAAGTELFLPPGSQRCREISRALPALHGELLRRGKQAQQAILTSHDDPAMRLWAARHSVVFAPLKAVKKRARSGGLIGIDALTVLRECQHRETEIKRE